jgi:hypothetical protein
MMFDRALYYVLDANGEPAVVDLDNWGAWFDDADARIVMQTRIAKGRAVECRPRAWGRGGVVVSTVFLAIDHAHDLGPPVLWETMIFGGLMDGDQWRYRSRLDALTGHAAAVRRVQAIRRLPRKTKIALATRTRGRLTPRQGRRVARFDAQVSRIDAMV